MSNRVTTGEVRLSWPRLHELKPRVPGGRPTISTAVLLPKTDTATLEAVKSAVAQAAADRWGAQPPRGLRMPNLRDGDAPAAYPEQAGYWVVNLTAWRLVPVVGRDLTPVDASDPSVVFGGQKARVALSAFAYDRPDARGVSLGLDMVQILGGGEPFAPAVDPAAVFGPPIGGDAAAPAGDPFAGVI